MKQWFFVIVFGIYLPVSILACDGGGGGTSSSTASDAPNAPNGLSARVVSSSKINLLWTDNSSNEEGFKIERLGSFAEIALKSAKPFIENGTLLFDGKNLKLSHQKRLLADGIACELLMQINNSLINQIYGQVFQKKLDY